jgi:molecular chaperone GrpE
MMMDEDKQLENLEDSDTSVSEASEGPGNGLPDESFSAGSGEIGSDTDFANADDSFPDIEAGFEATPHAASGTSNASIVADLSREIEVLKAQVEDRTSQYMRIAADFDNFRKRTQKERQELELQAKCSTIMELLPVVDNFERARSQIKPQTEQEMTIHKSYQSVYKQLVDCLKRIGVAPMRSEGKEFDPSMHEAVMRQPTDEYEEGVVMEELVRGYLLGERVLRHAMVKVAAAPEPAIASDNDESEDLQSE